MLAALLKSSKMPEFVQLGCIGGLSLAWILFSPDLRNGLGLALLAATLLGLLMPGSRHRTVTHIWALCRSAIGLIAFLIVMVLLLMRMDGIDAWMEEGASACLGAFVWMRCGLTINRKWAESTPLLLSIGALTSWTFFLNSGQSFGFPLTGLLPFICSLFGGWLGSLSPVSWQGPRSKVNAVLAIALAGLAIFLALKITPPGSPRTIRIGPNQEELAYLVYGGGNGVSVGFVLRLGSPSDKAVTVLYNNTWVSEDYAKLTLVKDPETIDDAYAALAAQDDKRCRNAIANGSIPPFIGRLWKWRRVPHRGSIWAASWVR